MVAPKKSRKPRASTAKNQYSTELTSGQLVMGLTILMVFGLACFLLGVVIGKYDPTIPKPINIAQQTPSEQLKTIPGKDNSKSRPAIPDKSTPHIEEKYIFVKREPKQDVKPADSVPQTAPIVSTDLPPGKTTATPDAKTVVAKTPKPTPPAAAPKRGWAVQAGAFKINANAQREKVRIQPGIPHTIDIVQPPGSTYHKLLIGSYPTIEEAIKVKEELATKNPKLGFSLSKPF